MTGIGSEYNNLIINVIDLFNGYKKKRGENNDGVDIDFLERRITSLKEGKYTLVVAGEVKAGKSTFINALLGAEILPSDVLQATSAIVEIFKSPTSYVEVKYADGHTVVKHDDLSTPFINEAKEFLKEVCCLKDEYRDIPVTLLNKFIVEQDVKSIDEGLLKELESQSGTKLIGYEAAIDNYLADYTLDKIPTEIQFGYPFKWEFDELRLVDSPGVNASGGVQDKTFEYIDSANAILFVHPIKPIESQSFRRFVESVICNRSKDVVFLVLTHAGLFIDDANRLYLEAKRLFEDFISQDKIIVVDSILRLIEIDLMNNKTMKEIRASSSAKKALISIFRDEAEDQNRELEELICEKSGFDLMLKMIDDFSFKAPMLQLSEILESIKLGYYNLSSECKEKIHLLEKQQKHPQEFENEIKRIQDALENYKKTLNTTSETVTRKYTGINPDWHVKLKKLESNDKSELKDAKNEEKVRQNFTNANDEIDKVISEFDKSITDVLKKKMEEIGSKFEREDSITVPYVDIETLKKKAKKEAFITEDEEVEYTAKEKRWYTLWIWEVEVKKKKTIPTTKFDNSEYLENLKARSEEQIKSRVDETRNKLRNSAEKYRTSFNNKINELVASRQQALEEIRRDKKRNEEIIEEMDKVKTRLNKINKEKKRTLEILENLR